MIVRPRRRFAAAGVCLGALALLATGCAHHVRMPALELGDVRARYEQALAARVNASSCALADLDVRVEGASLGRLPHVEMRVALQAPDRLRLRASWLLGTALDVCAQGDSVQAVVPPRHRAFVVGGGPSPIGPPAGRLLCALLALWRPDSVAWSTLEADSGLARVRWQESGDSLWLSIDGAGRPVALAWRAPDGPRMHVRYETWTDVAGTELPARLVVQDERGALRARLDLSGFEPRRTADPEWFALELPERTERVDWPELGRLLRRAGEDW